MSPQKQIQRPCKSYPCPIYLRASPEERQRIVRLAEDSAVSTSRYLVRLATEGRPPPSRAEREDLRSLRYLLQKIGNNLNQVAHRLNRAVYTGETPPTESEIASVVRAVRLLTRDLQRRLH